MLKFIHISIQIQNSPLFPVVVVYSINNVLLVILNNLPNSAPHHVARGIGGDGKALPLAYREGMVAHAGVTSMKLSRRCMLPH